MPIYEFVCDNCKSRRETKQKTFMACPFCGYPMRRVFGLFGVVLKGKGFYKTDNRAKK